MASRDSKIEWTYPLYLIPHGGGYASVVDQDEHKQQQSFLVVHTEREAAELFMRRCSLEGGPRPLHNDREFRWLLVSLRDPVRHVAFDPQAEMGSGLQARWTVDVQTLLEEHMEVDYSPWNYPVYVLQQDDGFASIDGRQADGQAWTAVGVFTRREKADGYLEGANETGTVLELTDLDEARDFLKSLEPDVSAVALDPQAEGSNRSAKHCFPMATLLEKYLVKP